MEYIKKLFLYAGIDKNQYDHIFPEVKKRNLKNLCIYSLATSVYFIVFLIYAIITTGFNVIYLWYLADAVLMTVFYLTVRYMSKKEKFKGPPPVIMNYLFMSLIYIDAIMITCLFPDRQSSAFFVRLVLMPVICMDTPIRLLLFQGLYVLIFYFVTPFYNLPYVVELDRSEIFSYLLISFLICLFITSIHIKEILHELGNEYLSNYDILTGVKNRNSFENEHLSKEEEKKKEILYVYADVNGLHEMNNTYGHEAGDNMLKTVATGLIKIFGAESSYRIGGDEFVSFTDSLSREETIKEISNLNKELSQKNYFVSFGIAGSDEGFVLKTEMIKAAEQRMYEEKKLFYQAKGIEFGSRKR